MNPRTLLIAVFTAFAMLLSACEFTVVPGNGGGDPFPNAETVNATTNPLAGQSDSLGPNDAVVYEVRLGSSVRANQAMYFEVDTDALDLILYSSSGAVLASSSSSDLFETGLRALSTLSSTVPSTPAAMGSESTGTQSIGTAPTCRGSCIIRDANASTFYLEVQNPTGSTITFDAYLFSERYADEYEPENDSRNGAVTLTSGDPDSGAIEHLRDVDWWRMASNGSLQFSAITSPGIDLEMRLYNASGAFVESYSPGGPSIAVFADETVEIHEVGNDAAGVAAQSQYSLELQ